VLLIGIVVARLGLRAHPIGEQPSWLALALGAGMVATIAWILWLRRGQKAAGPWRVALALAVAELALGLFQVTTHVDRRLLWLDGLLPIATKAGAQIALWLALAHESGWKPRTATFLFLTVAAAAMEGASDRLGTAPLVESQARAALALWIATKAMLLTLLFSRMRRAGSPAASQRRADRR
jgi:hypothetical protein